MTGSISAIARATRRTTHTNSDSDESGNIAATPRREVNCMMWLLAIIGALLMLIGLFVGTNIGTKTANRIGKTAFVLGGVMIGAVLGHLFIR